ncbi:MAG: Fis family transcriptional regulator [Proteobacteria bacterium]|nr:Fis family transcriptional regulator [Pseudomonadota bacterium]
MSHMHTPPLKEVISKMIAEYFCALDGQPAKELYNLVIKEVELGLFKTVLDYTGGNQSKAAEYLGLARGTLRKRLAEYGLE